MSNQATKPLKVFIHPVDAAGHINACIGLGQALHERGHHIYFLSDSSFKGQYEPYGFREIPLYDSSKNQWKTNGTENPQKAIANMLFETGLLSAEKSPAEKMKSIVYDESFFEMGQKKAVAYNDQIQLAINQEQPDLFIVDNSIVEPAIYNSGIPWIYLFSANPMSAFRSKDLPPFCLGYPTNSDKSTWTEYKADEKQFFKRMFDLQNQILRHFNCPEIPFEPGCETLSKYLNVYGFPEELDYDDIVPKPKNFVRVDAFCRKMPEPFQFPEEFQKNIKPDDKLIFVSMGSTGSFDVELMKRLVTALAKTSHKYIVVKGQFHEEFELADNMWGKAHLPQTSILPLVDLVITHGGNNTVTESFNFGKPMIVMPLFGDQYDNAQRIQEKGFGIRMDPYRFIESELNNAIDQLLNNVELCQKLAKISKRIEQSNSKEKACIAIEQMVEKHRQQVQINFK